MNRNEENRNRPGVRLSPVVKEDNYVRVAPVNLDYIKFGRFDPTTGRKAKVHRRKLLERASRLGRRFNEPVEIFFKSRFAKLKVREVVTSVEGNKVHLHDGRVLPIRVISSVRYRKKQ